MPFFLYPVFLISAGELPAGYFLRKVLLVAPFGVFVGIFNPVLDRQILFHLGPLGISGGLGFVCFHPGAAFPYGA